MILAGIIELNLSPSCPFWLSALIALNHNNDDRLCYLYVAGMFDYAVQVQPVIFIKEPQSQLTTEGQSLTLSCQIRLAPLVSYQPLPSIVWLKDDIIVTVEDSSMTISNNVSDGFSELIIPVINTSLSGSYQCLANDADERYSTISKKATITILAKG